MRLLVAESVHHVGDVVLLKEPDSGDPAGSRSQARLRVVQCDSPKSEHWDAGAAGSAKQIKANRSGAVFLEYRCKDCEVGGILCCPVYLFWRVTRDPDQRR